jgi:hypothetical protein
MTERWERQVRELSKLQAPSERIWSRVGEGPHPDRPPSSGRRVTAAVVALGVFMLGGLAAWTALRPTRAGFGAAAGGTQAIVTIRTPEQTGGAPEARFSNGLSVADGVLDEYMWDGVSHDEPFPPKLSSFLPVVQGTPLELEGKDQPDRTWVFLADPETFQALEGSAGVAADVGDSVFAVAPGDYVLVVQQSWGCHYESVSSTSCFVTGGGSQHQSLLTFYFGVTIAS